ncbi:MAG: hypothetical protein AABZ08_05210 [Planctomycetota bacterium]
MKHGIILSIFALAQMAWSAPAHADIIVEQLPALTGGPYSDTDYFNMFGQRRWQLEADNIQSTQNAIVRRVTWWGFYGGSGTPATPPPATETIQVRFMAARSSDGLPDESAVLFAQTFLNPMRTATGRELAGIGGRPLEYLFTADLNTPVALQSGVPYWLEIVQLGDVKSGFRWEDAFDTLADHAFINPLTPGWYASEGGLAFQLFDVPEPTTFIQMLVSATLVTRLVFRVRR